MKHWIFDSTNIIYVSLAAGGGMARYLNSYAHGARFHIGLFFANSMLSGFSGLMFAYVGVSLNMPPPTLFVFAGVGGFMGHSALEYLVGWITKKSI